MTKQNLNLDGVEAGARILMRDKIEGDSKSKRYALAEQVISAYLSALHAQTEHQANSKPNQNLELQPDTVNSVDYRSTPQGHYDAWQDTGDGYYQRKGWTLTCIWCGAEFTGSTKAEALKGYTAHEESIIQKLQEADAERAKERPVK